MELTTFIGISITEFWELTPNEINIAAKSYQKRKEIEQKEATYQSYLISRWVWQKKIDIEKILNVKKEKKSMTDEEMLERAKALNAIFGGEVKVIGKE